MITSQYLATSCFASCSVAQLPSDTSRAYGKRGGVGDGVAGMPGNAASMWWDLTESFYLAEMFSFTIWTAYRLFIWNGRDFGVQSSPLFLKRTNLRFNGIQWQPQIFQPIRGNRTRIPFKDSLHDLMPGRLILVKSKLWGTFRCYKQKEYYERQASQRLGRKQLFKLQY